MAEVSVYRVQRALSLCSVCIVTALPELTALLSYRMVSYTVLNGNIMIMMAQKSFKNIYVMMVDPLLVFAVSFSYFYVCRYKNLFIKDKDSKHRHTHTNKKTQDTQHNMPHTYKDTLY